MGDCVYMSWRRPVETRSKELIEARKNAIKNMVFFRNDKSLYVFWRNVYIGQKDKQRHRRNNNLKI